ncbi:Cytochrome c-type biogenesis protein CcmF [Candidatus Promineifilum breve]|uniref:Cytochrome c-type biogenesis protein CcmF n=1 Tax=Candidatus Promineifilum breve TaxID=1806508 RepID=A0A160T1N1_9CHLR|nr:heme lyase CcmF/NrfE family subunit [Candidatus Promineifilum breve]CUS03951.2 Cytochrome c-type biogenesis protein CcmF [Candidatus Promineifilum breve]
MIADIGSITLLLAFLVAIYGVVAAAYGARRGDDRWVRSARNAIAIIFPLVLLAALLIITALVTGDFSIAYVSDVSSRGMPTYLKVTALWGGQAGSLLFWNLLLAAFTSAAMLSKWRQQKELMPYVIIVAGMTQVFFLLISTFIENPFARNLVIPADGQGLNPLLRHPGMIIHPPMLYLGFVGFTIPYAFAMAALMSNQLGDNWIHTTRRWTLVAWLFLGLGLILGGRWAYDVLGWGGYWGWDPVENASLMPWLAGTAFLHSVMIQEKMRMFKMWNMFLIVLTYCLVILGTFIVRSGVISSVHAFAQSAIGPFFFGFIVIMFVFSAYWITKRRDALRSENQLVSYLSREAAFLYNNFLILAILGVVFLFTYYPIFSELFTGEKGFVGPPVYERALAPLFAALVLLMGVAPLTMWYRTSIQRLGRAVLWPAAAATAFIVVLFFMGVRLWPALLGFWLVMFSAILTILEFTKGTRARMRKGEAPWVAFSNLMARNRRRYGGYWIHMGVLIMAFGIVANGIYQTETQMRLAAGESITVGDFEMRFNSVSRFPGADDLLITEADVDLYRNGEFLRKLNPQIELYQRTGQPMTIPSARSTITEDFYVILVNWEPTSADAATFRIFLNPLINWVWAGGLIFVLGTLIAAWPDREKEPARARRPAVAVAGD